MSWLATFFAARIAPAVTGIGAKAIAIAVAATIGIIALALGVWAIRHDARMDERRVWEAKMARIEAAEAIRAGKVAQEAAALAAAERAALESELALAHETLARITDHLTARSRVIAYPKAIIQELNR